jgi:type IV secretion system protein VirB1
MDPATFLAFTLACAPQVHADTARALVQVESDFNPWAIGVVGGALERQPQGRAEAIATAMSLRRSGWNFSVGLAQINVSNVDRLGLTLDDAFEPCANLAAMQTVLRDCFDRAVVTEPEAGQPQAALRAALSCYYSGNFTTGLQQGYVHQVARASLHPHPGLLSTTRPTPIPTALTTPPKELP